MKKYAFLLLLSTALISCNNSDKVSVEEPNPVRDSLNAENEKLKEELTQKDSAVNSFMQSFNEIEENLTIIKEKEKIITESKGDVKNKKDQIVADIQAIYDLMAKNKQTINSMSGRLKKANLKIDEFQKMIERLNQQLADKDTEIESMKDQLEKLNIELTQVTENYNAKTEESNQKTSQLNTGYYAFGTSKELKTQGVITKEGGFIGIGKTEQLMKDFNKKYFTKIDIMQTTSIPLGSKKARILTTHPSSSYKMEGPEGKVEKLVITNPEEFWSSSKYLVIIVE
jgi:predicted nuclease with TOPRIM domain